MIYHVIKKDEKVYVQGAKGFTPKNNIGRVPQNIARQDWPFIQAIEAIDEFGQTYWNITVDQAAKDGAQAKDLKKKNLKGSKDKKRKAIADKVAEILPAMGESELVLKVEMWKAMSAQAVKFRDLGLKTVEQVNNADATELFSPGSALDTVKKIKDYADRKLEMFEEFLVAKAQAEQVFEDEQEAILGA